MDQEYTVDQEKQTITHNGDVHITGFRETKITLEYPATRPPTAGLDMGGARNTP